MLIIQTILAVLCIIFMAVIVTDAAAICRHIIHKHSSFKR